MNPLLVYKASAGSGKTFTLAVEYIKLLIANPYAYRNILAVTFTNKATAEMKVRIIGQLNGIAKGLESSQRYFDRIKAADEIKALGLTDEKIRSRAQMALSAMLHDYSRFRITTIDSFFQSIVRELAYELDLTANLRVDINTKEALTEAVKSIVSDINQKSDASEKDRLLGILTTFIYERIAADKAWNILGEIEDFSDNIFKEQYLKQHEKVRQSIGDAETLSAVKDDLNAVEQGGVEKIQKLGDALVKAMKDYENEMQGKSKGPIGVARRMANFKQEKSVGEYIKKLSSIPGANGQNFYDDIAFWAKSEAVRDKFVSLGLLNQYRLAFTEVNTEIRKIVTARIMLLHINEMMLLNTVNEVLRQKNRENNRFILADTAHFLREMIDDLDVPFIYERTGTRYKHIMIDEFQDTSELQWENFRPLLHNSLADNSRCLIVGDVKQSIYRWRNSDWRTLNDMEYGEFQDKITLPPLDTNYRSSEQVVTFNNAFFKKAARFVAQKYNEVTTFADGSNAAEDRAQAIATAYKEVEQKVPKDHLGYGYVRVEHLLYTKDEEEVTPTGSSVSPDSAQKAERKSKEDIMLDAFKDTMTELLEKGVQPKDIAVLVRQNWQGVKIADCLKEHFPHVKVVSNEAFLLDSSLAVNMLISALRVLSNPQNEVERYALAALYHREVKGERLKAKGEGLKVKGDEAFECFANSIFRMSKEQIDALLPLGDEANRRALAEVPLYELCEHLYDLLGLKALQGQDAYLYTFFDQLLHYLQDNRATLDAFLSYWDETMHAAAVPMGSADGVQILTIHKSKGLEFHTVILPFCDGKADGIKSKNKPLLWCTPTEEPFNVLQLAPIEYGTTMKESLFHKEFDEELLRQLVDNLNVLYVAFTRAENNLIVLTGSGADKEVGSTASDLSDIINMALLGEEHDGRYSWPAFKGEAKTYTFGTMVPSTDAGADATQRSEAQPDAEVNYLEPKFEKQLLPFRSSPTAIEFRQSNESARFLRGDADNEEEQGKELYIEAGNFYHALLERIHTLEDLPRVVAEFEHEGLIAGAEHKKEVVAYLQRIFENQQAQEWFQPQWRVLNEQNILIPLNADKGKRFERPDRVICNGETTIVIDYKTGGMKTLKHLEQVADYVALLQSMGYPHPKGYVWYLKYNEIVPVTL
ncbi:MAG: UvrD-helicase domain-containing protein [Bacteroidaceae bacterium]|nr:UvrD-helicase domain-containing protein [Bacteroidaceae bacterium]